MKNIMFDVDGVLADFILKFTSELNKLDGTVKIYGTNDQPEWNFVHDKKLLDKCWRQVKKSSNWWTDLKPMIQPNTFMAISTLQRTNQVYFVTSRVQTAGRTVQQQTAFWLENHGISHPNVIASSLKGEVAHALGATHSIEDKWENAQFIRWYSKGTKSYIIDRPYNRLSKFGSDKVIRVDSVDEYLKEIENG